MGDLGGKEESGSRRIRSHHNGCLLREFGSVHSVGVFEAQAFPVTSNLETRTPV